MNFTCLLPTGEYPIEKGDAVAVRGYVLPAAFGLGGLTLGRDVPLHGGVAGTLARVP